jgi:hypothetical protein
MRAAPLGAPKENPATRRTAGRVPGPITDRGDQGGRRGNASDGPVFRNRLDQIALRSQFGHWALRSEGAWGYRVLLPTPCDSAPLAHDWRGAFS